MASKKNGAPGFDNKCPHCECELIEGKDLLLANGKTLTKKVMCCKKCGKTYSDLFELQRIENIIKPSLLDKIKSYFNRKVEVEELNLFRGKVL